MGIYRPAPPLSDFVEFFWASEAHAQPHAVERLLPTGTMDLVIDLAPGGHATIAGARSKPFLLDTTVSRALIGARFTIGGGFVFFGSAGDLRDLSVPLEAVWGRAAEDLRERLAATPTDRFAVLERFLVRRLDGGARFHSAIRHARMRLQRSGGAISVGALTEECGLSRRRFIELFHEQVGLPPKLYARLCRFRRSLAAIGSAAAVDWADLAAAGGYSDQPHLVHEFQAFAGMNPSAYLRHRTAHVNHLREPG